jgi:hypothetical protein
MFDFLSPVQWGIVAAALAAVVGIYVPWGSFKFPSFGGKSEANSAHEALDHLAAVQQYIFNHGRGPSALTANTKIRELAHAIVDSSVFASGDNTGADS